MPQDDIIIAKALTAGLRRLLVAAFVHQREITPGPGMAGLNDALRREIARLAMRGETDQGEDVELTAAVRNGLLLFADAAYREASERQEPPDKIQ